MGLGGHETLLAVIGVGLAGELGRWLLVASFKAGLREAFRPFLDQLDALEERLEGVEERLEGIDGRLEALERSTHNGARRSTA